MDDTPLKILGDGIASEPVRLITDHLSARIAAGKYSTRLPSERLLAKEFDVTRNTIRGALKLLEENDVIERRLGSGNFIKNSYIGPSDDSLTSLSPIALVAENTGPLKLNMVRGVFEPELVRLAIEHTSPRNIDVLRQIVDRMELIHKDVGKFAQCEESFCLQLAQGTENPLLIAVYELIIDVRRLSNWRGQREAKLNPERIRECQVRYRSMFDAIERRDAASAVKYFKMQLADEQNETDEDE